MDSDPSRAVLELLGRQPTALLLPALAAGPHRFGELRRALPGIDQQSLTRTLRDLERDGLVSRTLHDTIPPRVDYALTDLGRDAAELLAGLRGWAGDHLPAIEAARAAYDRSAATA